MTKKDMKKAAMMSRKYGYMAVDATHAAVFCVLCKKQVVAETSWTERVSRSLDREMMMHLEDGCPAAPISRKVRARK